MLQSLSPRQVFVGLTLLALGAIAFARLYLQAYLGLEACPLCMSQRVFVVLWGAIALLAAVHNPGNVGQRIYAALCGLAAFPGALIAARHVWLQNLPEDQVPACGPSLEYMLETFPFQETLRLVMMGDGNCADTLWTAMGLSIPEQTLGLFSATLLVCLWQSVRRYP